MAVVRSESHDWGLVWGQPSRSSFITYMAGCFERSPTERRTEPASANLSLFILLQGSISVASESGQPRPAWAFVCPPRARHVEVRHPGPYRAIEIGLSHDSAKSLWSISLGELPASAYALDELAPSLGERLQARLHGTHGWNEAFAAVEAAFRTARRREVDPRLLEARHLIQRSFGTATVDCVAKRVGWSRRCLAARFREEFGIGPKIASRIARFERAAALLRGGAPPARVAGDCGYCDQSHMHRDFLLLGASTPGQSMKRALPPLESAWFREGSAS